MRYIAFDSHKRSTFASGEEAESGKRTDARIEHTRGAIREFLKPYEPQTPVAVETIGNWYWIVDEIEAAGMQPRLVHARKAKMMLASSKKTDKLDAYGMNRLQRTGTLPTVGIPDGELRDTRELFRTRMVLARQSTRLKNRILATLAKYAITLEEAQDVFSQRGRRALEREGLSEGTATKNDSGYRETTQRSDCPRDRRRTPLSQFRSLGGVFGNDASCTCLRGKSPLWKDC